MWLSHCAPVWAEEDSSPVPLIVRQRTGPDGEMLPMTAFNRELLGYFERSLGARFDYRPYPWKRAAALALHGEGLLWGMPKDADETGTLVFSEPVYATNIWMVARKADKLKVDGLKDLKGKVLSAFRGCRYTGEFEAMRDKLFRVEEDPDSFVIRLRKLHMGRVDVVLLHSRRATAEEVLKNLDVSLPEIDDLVILPKPMQREQIRFAALRDSPHAKWIPKLNQIIAKGRKKGEIQKIVEDS
ncbi:ABC transporter substrate-binding protein [Chitinimonas sp. DQS-5]|uniref:ABC transporter substrate-binding protein n=1 Tax=Parachitinimonas caeni TaxID=3031301 RepID=A0ABT7DYM9_9NEIS|nr:ABC transporter substrate-binding protein [Parachitinimonas caeni]MDK2124255.1 ABC transporter substrate-binding protein [Parachitinimonas caeni]